MLCYLCCRGSSDIVVGGVPVCATCREIHYTSKSLDEYTEQLDFAARPVAVNKENTDRYPTGKMPTYMSNQSYTSTHDLSGASDDDLLDAHDELYYRLRDFIQLDPNGSSLNRDNKWQEVLYAFNNLEKVIFS